MNLNFADTLYFKKKISGDYPRTPIDLINTYKEKSDLL